jgi:hypothetical protein
MTAKTTRMREYNMVNLFNRITYRVLVLVSVLSVPLLAHAAQRTFVSSTGNDITANCGISDPCRSFSRAMSFTDPNGEIIVKDSAGYGPVTITQSVSIIAPQGVYAGISVFSGDGITIAGSGVKVVLRGLSINGQGGFTGISFGGSGTLHVENCAANNMNGNGFTFSPNAASEFYIKDSVFRNNGINGGSAFGAAKGSIDRSRFEDNVSSGFVVFNTANVSVRDSVASGNGSVGI